VPENVGQPETTIAEQTRQLPPYRVLLHNDDVNSFDHVIRSIQRLTPLKLEEAVERTLEAHERGVSLLLVTHRERAELYVEQFASVGLTVTCEPEA
jgi:ATP-dependent Clp protease adaptor protein ClpS